MALSPKTIRAQMARLKPMLASCSLETMRKGQDLVGELVSMSRRGRYLLKEHPFTDFTGTWVIPKDERRQGVVLYLHGGGYTCGGADYAKGFGIVLAERFGVMTIPTLVVFEGGAEKRRSVGFRPKQQVLDLLK